MATSRRRSSGFTEKPKVDTEAQEIEKFLDEATAEMFETISQEEEQSAPFVEESITPTPNEGPRFVEEPPTAPIPTPPSETRPPILAPRPKLPRRAQRNVPRFSRVK